MTAYFDSRHERLRELETQWTLTNQHQHLDQALELEKDLLRDCLLVSELPGFPTNLHEPLYLTLGRHATEPLNVYWYADDEDEAATFKRLHDLVWNLHTIWHSVGQSRVEGFCDKPDMTLMWWSERGYDRRIETFRRHPEFAQKMFRYDAMCAKVEAELRG